MNLSTTIPSSNKKTRTSLPWGHWGVRSIALAYLAFLLVIPLLVIVRDGTREGLAELWRQITLPAAWHALQLTLWTAAVMTIINTVMGTLTAFVLVRYDFPGKRILIRRILGHRRILPVINRLRTRFGRSEIESPSPETAKPGSR